MSQPDPGAAVAMADCAGVRCAPMPGERSIRDVLRNMLQESDLSFRDFVEVALYHPELGYYARAGSPVGKGGDFVTAPLLSPVFAFAVGKLLSEFVSRAGDGMSEVVDIGCGDGSLIRALVESERGAHAPRFIGVDRSLSRLTDEARLDEDLTFVRSLAEVPPTDARLVISNELFDALPFARLVRRGENLHELWVTERDGELDWTEHEADARYEAYFAERGIELEEGQFADVSLDWQEVYGENCRFTGRGLIVTFDYGLPQRKLFRGRMRRFGTAAAYSRQRVSRDLLANAGEQDLTAHINFDDLSRTGEFLGFSTLFFDSQAKFLLALGITDHPLFTPVHDLSVGSAEEGIDLLDRRDDAKRLILPDGIGEDIRVLVQARGVPLEGWRFQRKLF